MGMSVIAASCGCVLLVLGLRKRGQIVLNFLVRMVLGAIVMLFVNDFFETQNIYINVGFNPVSLLTSGILGFPGVALLYGIEAVKFL